MAWPLEETPLRLPRLSVVSMSSAISPEAWSLFNIPQDERLNHRCELVAGVLHDECAAVLEDFFRTRR